MIFFKKLLLSITFASFGLLLKAQTKEDTMTNPYWIDMMQESNPNYFKTKRAFDLYFIKHDELAKGSGAKHFRRWEHRVRDRVDAQGNVVWFKGQLEGFVGLAAPQGINGMAPGVQQPATPCPGAGEWHLVGPDTRPYNQSGQPNGTGRINTVAFHPTDTNTYFGCSPQGGLWKTTDAGESWTMIFGKSTGVNTIGVSSLAINPSNTNIMYLGTGDIDGGDAPGYGVMKSTDAGKTWTQVSSGMGNRTVGRIIIDPNNLTFLLASTNAGVYRSANSGSSWTRTSLITSKATDLAFNPGNSQTVYSSFSNGRFYKSNNNGVNWTYMTKGLPTSGLQRGQIAVTKADTNYVYYVISRSSQFEGLYKSINSGDSFVVQSTTPNILGYSSNGGSSGGQGWYDLDIAASPLDKDEILVAGVNLWKSTNGGANWTISGHWTGSASDDVHADQHGIEYSKSGYQILNGNDGGVYITSDGGTVWHNINNDISNSQIYRMAQAQTDEFVSNHGYQDNGSAVTEKNQAYTYWGGDGTDALIDPTDHKYIYGAYVRGSIYRVYDKTNGRTIANNGTGGVNESGAWVTPFVLQEGNTLRFFAGYRNIWRTDDVRATTPVFTKISNSLGGTNSVTYKYLESNPAQTNMLYALRNDNDLYRTSNADATSPTWTDLSSSLPSSSRWVECHPTDSNIVYLAANSRVYRSINRGSTWASSVSFSGLGNVKCIVFDTSAGTEALYVGTEKGIYYTTFSGSTGTKVDFNNNFAIWSDVTDIDMYYSPKGRKYNHVIVSTYGRSVWRSAPYDGGVGVPEARAHSFDSIVSVGATLKLYDNSRGTITNRTWKISPSDGFSYENGTDSTSLEPEIKTIKKGVLRVDLIVSNCQGSDTLKKINWIRVFPSASAINCNPTTTYRTNNLGIGLINFELTDNNIETGLYKHDDEYNDLSKRKSFRLVPSTTYTAKIKAGTFNNTRVRVYIDYDNNGKFEASNNEILASSTWVKGYRNYTITTPSNLQKNQMLRVRVRSDYGTPSTDPCANSTYGDAEDYSILYDFVDPDFEASTTTLCLNQTTTFKDTSEGIIGDYYWHFGSGASPATASGKGPHTVSYTTTGMKDVLYVVNGEDSLKKTNYINVSGISTGSASISLQHGSVNSCVNDSINLRASFSQTLTGSQTYQWRLNGSNISGETDSTLAISKIKKSEMGNYSCLITDGSCPALSPDYAITVYDLPNVKYGKSADMCFKGNTFNFIDSSTSESGNAITSRSWNFGPVGANSTLNNPNYSYSAPGSNTVKLIINTTYGCKDSLSKTTIVHPQATLASVVDKANQCLKGNSYKFTANASVSSGSISSTNWTFGDGSTSTSTNPSKIYTAMGSYSASLRTNTNNGCKDTINIATRVYGMPIPGFTRNDSTQCFRPHQLSFTNGSTNQEGTITGTSWNFGDGNGSTATSPNHTYSQAGNYSVTLNLTNSLGCKDSTKKNVYIYQNASNSFTVNDKTQCLRGNSFVFTNASSISSGSLTYVWNFGQGSPSTLTSPTKTYTTATSFDVQLISTSNNGCKDSSIQTVTTYATPSASYTINDATQCLKGNDFAFTNNSSISAGTMTYNWTFADGNTSTSTSPRHSYAANANYLVKLKATSNFGCLDSTIRSVQVFEQSKPAFTINDNEQCLRGNYFNYPNTTPSSSGLSFRWDFGNGASSTFKSGGQVYGSYGNYSVLLVSTTGNGCKDSVSKMVMVRDQPKANFSINKDKQCLKANSFVNLVSSTCADAMTHKWTYPTGNSTGSSLTRTYTTAGAKSIKLVSISSYGCEDSSIQVNTVHPQTMANFTINKDVQCENFNKFTFTNASTNSETFTNQWSFGDSKGSSAISPSNSYATDGNYSVRLITNTINGCLDSLSKMVTVNPSPEAKFTTNQTADCENGNAFNCTNTSSISSGSNSYRWLNGEGNSASTKDYISRYTKHGSFRISLIANSDKDCKDTASQDITVYPSPKAAFTSNQTLPACENETLGFTNKSTLSAGLLSYTWDNDDGKTANTTNFSTSYSTYGIKNLRLIAKSDKSCEDTATWKVDIASIPRAAYSLSPPQGCAFQTKFVLTSSSINRDGRAIRHAYSFGDGSTSTLASPSYTFKKSGTYSSQLILSSDYCKDSTGISILVLDPVSAAFTMDSLNQESWRLYALDSNTTAAYTYSWSISDGKMESNQGFDHTFKENKNYSVQLIVDNNKYCRDTVIKQIVLLSPNYKKQDNGINFYVYPNPTSGKFTYKFEITEKRPLEVKLVTIDGHELWSRDWGTLEPGVYYQSLDFTEMDVAKGTYPFQIKSNDDIEQIKLIFSN